MNSSLYCITPLTSPFDNIFKNLCLPRQIHKSATEINSPYNKEPFLRCLKENGSRTTIADDVICGDVKPVNLKIEISENWSVLTRGKLYHINNDTNEIDDNNDDNEGKIK